MKFLETSYFSRKSCPDANLLFTEVMFKSRDSPTDENRNTKLNRNILNPEQPLTGSAVITHDVTTGTGYCLVGFNWIIDFLN